MISLTQLSPEMVEVIHLVVHVRTLYYICRELPLKPPRVHRESRLKWPFNWLDLIEIL